MAHFRHRERISELSTATVAIAALVVTGAHARSRKLHDIERAIFNQVNACSDTLNPVLYVLMQAGQFGAVPTTAVLALTFGRGRLAKRLVLAGVAAWILARLVKLTTGRKRPEDHIDAVKVRGKRWTGLGFPSGHSAVAAALASVAGPDLGPYTRLGAWLLVGIVATARMYVGAHLPLDTVGGIALGIAAGNTIRLLDVGSGAANVASGLPT